MKAPYRVREFFAKKYSRRYNTAGLMYFGGDANAAANKYYKKQEYQDLYNSSVCFHFERDAARVQHEPPT